MPSISKIRFTNVIYENGDKRYNDDTFQFEGHNGAIILENGGGKTVFIQAAIQAVLPHAEVAGRKIKDTLSLENNAAHIAIEWIISERPRRYALTCVTLFINKASVDSYRYVYEYEDNEDNSIDKLPFVMESAKGNRRSATKDEIADYYITMSKNRVSAHTFSKIKDYHEYIENNFKIISSEWRKIALINGTEGGVEAFFDSCKTTGQLVDNLLIPVVEDALSGNGTRDFAETFEKQREHFKKYKELKARVEESKLIDSHIESFVDVFENYNDISEKFTGEKERTKAIYNFVEKEQKNNKEKLDENKNQKIELKSKENYLIKQNLSYDLAVLQKDLESSRSEFNIANDKFKEINNRSEEKKKTLCNLKASHLRKGIKDKEDSIKFISESISKLDEDEDIQDIKTRMANNTRELKGYFSDEEHKLSTNSDIVKGQLRNYENKYQGYINEIKRVESEKTKIENEKRSTEKTIEIMNEDMNKIAREILANPSKEEVEEENIKWQIRTRKIEEESFNYSQEKDKSENEKNSLNSDLPKLRVALNRLTSDNSVLGEKLNKQREEEEKVKNQLNLAEIAYGNNDSLYSKQPGIINHLETKNERLLFEKEKLILSERISCKFSDDYKANEYFMADPIIEGLINNWKSNFSYIETGSSYVEMISKNTGKTEKNLYDIYPYWAISIVISDADALKLIEKIKSNNKLITHPVFVLTVNEARNKINDKVGNNEFLVFPGIWEDGLVKTNFQNWKGDMEKVAKEATMARIEKEDELNTHNSIQKNVRVFFDSYPYDQHCAILQELKVAQDNMDRLKINIEEKEARIVIIEQDIKKYGNLLNDLQDEKNVLDSKILRSQEYIEKKGKKSKGEVEKNRLEDVLQKNRMEFSKYDSEIVSIEGIIDDIKSQLDNIKDSISRVIGKELYKEVSGVLPKFSEKSEELLRQERKGLKDQIEKKQRGRDDLEYNLSLNKSDLDSFKQQINDLLLEGEFEIDDTLDFPINGLDEISRVTIDINKIKMPLKKLEKEKNSSFNLLQKIENTYELRKGDFYKKYDEIVSFKEELKAIKIKIAKEQDENQEQEKYLLDMETRLMIQKKDIDDIVVELRMQNGKYMYLVEDIKEGNIEDGFKETFPYNRKKYVSEILERLKGLSYQCETRKKSVEDKKQKFIKFCETGIMDVKLKDMAVSGVQYKNNYEDIKEWQKSMKGRIEKIIELVEGNMREHDIELQQFIKYLNSYLLSIAEELRCIPKKTRIKLDNTWKEVFTFNIPEWNEKEGKEELIKYVEWMLSQLENEKFRDENGIEDEMQVKKAIEKWLSSKQLLQHVMKQNTIKVKCRKVTNDGKVNSIPFSWEQSNLWSGGEKWSKNMTLFLGILNYTAEKRTQITSSYARHRTVILDNPFGKASSDHVLDPVFFIAKQLGFQIIALTALAEGKFIRTYFPIVYSCRLKNPENSDVQIMTKEMEVRKAFFKDNDPQTLVRLGQIQQVSLFD